jgi:hypothetical protein
MRLHFGNLLVKNQKQLVFLFGNSKKENIFAVPIIVRKGSSRKSLKMFKV